ncbi:enoyl-CoA hydratase/isomerase family protein [Rhizosaccharibacter radicis]|uniref:3-hydroxyisobutyryl-CoA hydrolase n=1 Tax=Rhizosaccharibacter radicis TaxID=2782605 RepID=A0ABT1W0M5_9PROT|nr:enoyl-CoA hydratase/isomerase family protein [Acetobacteraceae bacterium KSS12]
MISAADAAVPTAFLRVEKRGRAGRILLDRPRALHALDEGMVLGLHRALEEWRHDPAVDHVVFASSTPGRAFCAGGDIRAGRELALAGRPDLVERYFEREYALNAVVASYPKPTVALVDGVCMGGGVGLALHCRHRLATPASVIAMPETAIGFFPDVGATFLFRHLPPGLAAWLALTGGRLDGQAAAALGLIDAAVSPDRLAAIDTALDGPGAVAADLLPGGDAARRPVLTPGQERLAAWFDPKHGLDGILRRLEADGGEEARRQLALLRSMSPFSLRVVVEQFRRAAGLSLADCLALDLHLARRLTARPDFVEGVRAVLVDKDRQPRWRPARLEDVSDDEVAAVFAGLED